MTATASSTSVVVPERETARSASYAPAASELRGRERIGLAQAAGLAAPARRRATNDARDHHPHAGAVARQDVRGRRPPSLAPDGRLARDLLLDCAHIG